MKWSTHPHHKHSRDPFYWEVELINLLSLFLSFSPPLSSSLLSFSLFPKCWRPQLPFEGNKYSYHSEQSLGQHPAEFQSQCISVRYCQLQPLETILWDQNALSSWRPPVRTSMCYSSLLSNRCSVNFPFFKIKNFQLPMWLWSYNLLALFLRDDLTKWRTWWSFLTSITYQLVMGKSHFMFWSILRQISSYHQYSKICLFNWTFFMICTSSLFPILSVQYFLISIAWILCIYNPDPIELHSYDSSILLRSRKGSPGGD